MNFGQSKTIYAPYSHGGVGVEDSRNAAAINEAEQLLMNKAGWKGLLKCVRFCVTSGCVTLPRDIEKIIKSRLDGNYAHVMSKWYEFLEDGAGMLEDDGSPYIDLYDRGNVVTQYDMPEPMRILVQSTVEEEVGAKLLIRGWDEYNLEIMSNTPSGRIMGEWVEIKKDTATYTNNNFSAIRSITKPITNGYVFFSAVEFRTIGDDNWIWREHLSSMHPDETEPEYRRYNVKQVLDADCAAVNQRLNALVKLKHVMKTRDSDLMQIGNMTAMKRMLQSLRYADEGELSKAADYETQAENILLEEIANHATPDSNVDVQVEAMGMGDIPNV